MVNKLRQFSSAEFVITNRLHGMLFSIITQTPVIALDNVTGKIKSLYNTWLKHFSTVRFVSSKEELVSAIGEIKSIASDNSNNSINVDVIFGDYFKQLKDIILR